MEVVGRGAYGEVVLAKNKANGEMCAIKILEKSYLAKVSRERRNKSSAPRCG